LGVFTIPVFVACFHQQTACYWQYYLLSGSIGITHTCFVDNTSMFKNMGGKAAGEAGHYTTVCVFLPVMAEQPNNPLHGITLETILHELVAYYGWEQLGQRIQINCFIADPSIQSSLKFLRKTPWARKKVEDLYLYLKTGR